ncbi:MAG: tRNA (N(6)-L-threonylcarbamoyladenosine(37)-C(2))-methylthiotransferase MtaB [Clostridiales bacterium]|jgi:threonylcarbamoyladenosine tRNA methylthiotransferase MtaB|nr:tRNA (N(6)-L-threonylcarbamoyladenosine(37)-C(2))-methylthiotransferase MtaB [Clostridiales bacterium]
MKRVAFYTLGCKVNQYESEALEELFINEGYTVVGFDQSADVYVINTCTVTHHGDSKSRQAIRRAKRKTPDAVVVVMGCYVQVSPDEVMAVQGVDVVVGTADKSRVVSLVEEARRNVRPIKMVRDFRNDEGFEELALQQSHSGRTRAFVKVQEGCRQFCTYCVIPYARGPLRSRPVERVVEQIERLVELGYREVVLTGIHVTSYGVDTGTDIDLLGLIKRVHRIPGLDRIRLSSLEPTYVTAEFIGDIAGLRKVCRHFHLSLQSGCDETLKRMGRRYTAAQYREIVQRLKETLPGVAVTTDVMVGFPGETGKEFEKTYRFLEDLRLYNMHVFKYSPRRGTPAAAFPGQVSARDKDERSSALIDLASRCRKSFHNGFVGKSLKVLYEQKSSAIKGHYEGLTDNYIKVLVPANRDLNNRLIETRLLESSEDYMLGRL